VYNHIGLDLNIPRDAMHR